MINYLILLLSHKDLEDKGLNCIRLKSTFNLQQTTAKGLIHKAKLVLASFYNHVLIHLV